MNQLIRIWSALSSRDQQISLVLVLYSVFTALWLSVLRNGATTAISASFTAGSRLEDASTVTQKDPRSGHRIPAG